jgi:hypothetical protein
MIGPLKLQDGEVVIRFGVERACGGGFLPVCLRSWETYWPRRGYVGMPREEALEMARARAEEEKAHYAGDWSIELREVEFQ